ncbi:protein eva-1 homolog C-like isoform 2-T2 [Alca torda]
MALNGVLSFCSRETLVTPIRTDTANCGSSSRGILLSSSSWLSITGQKASSSPQLQGCLWVIISDSSLLSPPHVSVTSLIFSKPLTTPHGILLYMFFSDLSSCLQLLLPFTNQLGYSVLLSSFLAAMLDIRFAASPPSLPQPHSGPVCPVNAPAQDAPTATSCQEPKHRHRRGPSVSSGQRCPCSPHLGYLRKVLRNHTAHTCDGEQLLIVCPRKTTISILGAFYGRRVPSPNLCPSPGNASQESTECTSATAHLKLLSECQDQQWCQFSVHSQVFGPDPCPGTHKYLIASYKCRPGNHRVKTVCENDKLRLQCRSKSVLAIYSANYGRFLRGKPECDALNAEGPRIECLAPDALRRVSKKCHRKGNCTVAADRATFGDPCLPGMKKQLRVSYTCVPKQLLEEVGPDTSNPFLLSDYMHGVPEKVGLYFLCGVSGGLMLLLCIISPKTTFLQEVGEALRDTELGSSSELSRTKLRDEQDEDLPDDSSSDSSFRRLTRTYRATDSIFSPELTAAMEGAVEHQGRGGEEIWMPKESSPYAIQKIKSATK